MPYPNILWICSDQQRFDTLGCYGNAFVRSPNLDRLAEGGVLFENCFSQSPVCTPSRASFLTGRYPCATRTRQNGQNIPADEVLVTKILADAGYVCGLSGKLHLSVCNPSACPEMERRIDDGYTEFHWSHHPRPDWPGNEYGQWLAERGVEYTEPPREDCRWVLDGMAAEHHQTTWCAQKAIDFMEARSGGEQPWLFSVNIFDPHHAFDPPEEYLRPYLDRLDEIPLPNFVEGELAGKPVFQQIDSRAPYGGKPGPNAMSHENMTPRDHRLVRAAYWAMCDLIDDQAGRMIEALERTGQIDNTLVIYTSDHGEMLGDHGIYLKGPHFYDPAIHVPLIVSFPGRIEPGRRSGALVELTDLAQTILDAAGISHHPGMQGKSLWPLLTGEADASAHREDVYCEYYNAMGWHAEPRTPHATMVRTDRTKIVVFHGMEIGELYDLQYDPNETHNLWSDPAAADLKAAMLKRVCDRMAWTVDPLPPRLGPW
jgi:arylsulfatase